MAGCNRRRLEESSMTNPSEAALAREFMKRGLTRRQIIAIGAGLGLAASSLSTVLTLTGHEARAQESIFDKNAGAEGPWPETAVPEPTEKITLSVAHSWDATFMERQNQFDE